MTIYSLDCELVTTATLAETFAVFEDPYNLAKITPASMGFEIVTKDLVMREGVEIDYIFRWMGLPLKWRTRITAYDPPHLFVDEALKSPYSLWKHTHTFTQTPLGTLVSDHVEYALPLGVLGQIAHAVAVKKQLRGIFDFRQSAMSRLLPGKVIDIKSPRIAVRS